MWSSYEKVTVSKTSHESFSVTDTKKTSHHLRSPKAKMTDLRDILQKENINDRSKTNGIYENGKEENLKENKLRKNVKDRLQKENVNEDCISKEAIPLPWEPVKPTLPCDDETLASSVSENVNKRVVVELKWLDSDGHASTNGSGEQAACGFKASLTLAEADKVNEFIAHLRKDDLSKEDSLIIKNHKLDEEDTPTRGKTLKNSRHDNEQTSANNALPTAEMKAKNNTNAFADEKSTCAASSHDKTKLHEFQMPDLTPREFSKRYSLSPQTTQNSDILPIDAQNISKITKPKTKEISDRHNQINTASEKYDKYSCIPTTDTDTTYSRAKADRDTRELDRMVQSALALARARKEVSLQKILENSDGTVSRTRRYRTRDSMSMSRTTESDSYPSKYRSYSQRSRASCEPTEFSAMPAMRHDSANLDLEDNLLNRPSTRATSMPAGSRSLKALKLAERDIATGSINTGYSSVQSPLSEENVEVEKDKILGDENTLTSTSPLTDNTELAREESPCNGKLLALPEIVEEQDALDSIAEEMDMLTTYHGAGVFCPLTTDDIPQTTVQANEPRRGRSVSVMRRLLSEGEGQYSRESTPMGSLRKHFKARMKTATLHEAASQGNLKEFKILLEESDVEVNSTDQMGRTILHMAAEKGQRDVVTLLLEKGCDVNVADAGGRTALHYAVESGEAEVVSSILAAGARTDIAENSRGRTPIHLATVANSLEVLQILLQPLIDDPWEGMKILKLADKDGRTLLHMTAHHGLQEATSLLLTAGAEVNAKDFSGNTPMHAVILTRLRRKDRICSKVLEILLDSGGDVEGGGGGDEGGDAGTLLHAAASVGCLECLRVLVKRSAKMEAKDFFGKTPLQIAIEENHVDAVSFLLDNNASMEDPDSRGQRALHHAIMADGAKLVENLLIMGADSNALDRDDKTFFQFALLKRRYQALNALIKHNVTDVGEDQRAIHYCASMGNQAAIDVLLNNGFNINEADVKGRTALHHAISSGHESLVLYLLSSGASPRRADDNGATPLHYAVRWGGSDALLRRLVKKEGNVNAVDRLGRTPLHYAASKSSIMSDMYILVNNGAQINSKDKRGLTPLHLAARLGNESLVRILLDNDARHDIPDCDDFLPIDHARENGHKCIIKRLEAYHIKKEREKETRLTSYITKSDSLETEKRQTKETKDSEDDNEA